jgi:hypothetical protein
VIEPPRCGAHRRNNSGNQRYEWKPEISWFSNLKTLCQSAQLLAGQRLFELRSVLVGRQQAPQKRIRPGKPNWCLQDDDAIGGENPQHFFYEPRNIKMVNQGDTELYIHRFIREPRIVS